MKVKIFSNKGDKLEFLLEDTDISFANSLRRVMISEVPTMSVEWVDIVDNNSVLFDEVISHRFGMMPVKFDPDKFVFTEDCKCKGKGCPLCQVVFVLDKKGPSIVRSGDLKTSDKSVTPTDPEFILAELLEGQAIKLEAVVRLGLGTKHAKHHAANASYNYYPVITVKGSAEDAKNAVKACPKGILEVKGTEIDIKDPSKCDLCRLCMENSKNVEIKGDPSRIVFRVESVSGLKPEYIVSKAAEILGEKAAEFKKHMEKI